MLNNDNFFKWIISYAVCDLKLVSIWLPFLKFNYIFSIYYGHVALQFSPWHKLDLIRLVVRLKRVSSDSLILHRLKIKHWMPWASQAYSSTCMFHFHKKIGMSVVERSCVLILIMQLFWMQCEVATQFITMSVLIQFLASVQV